MQDQKLEKWRTGIQRIDHIDHSRLGVRAGTSALFNEDRPWRIFSITDLVVTQLVDCISLSRSLSLKTDTDCKFRSQSTRIVVRKKLHYFR